MVSRRFLRPISLLLLFGTFVVSNSLRNCISSQASSTCLGDTFPNSLCQNMMAREGNIILSERQPRAQTRIGAYYYLWYGIPIPNDDNWNLSVVKGTPSLGYYNSSDPQIAEQHILLAKKHKIDFFAISWIGEGKWVDWIPGTPDHTWDFDEIDNNLQNGFLDPAEKENFTYCLFYETDIVLSNCIARQKNFTEIFLNDVAYASKQYFNRPTYLRIEGKPVLFIYDLPYLYGSNNNTVDVPGLFDTVRQQLIDDEGIYLIGDLWADRVSPGDVNSSYLYSLNATTNYLYSSTKERVRFGWDSVLENAATYYPEWRHEMNAKGIKFIPNAYPGYNNTNAVDANDTVVLTPDAEKFREFCEIAENNTNNELRITMIASWNEWKEATTIEPSKETNELFLDTLISVILKFRAIGLDVSQAARLFGVRSTDQHYDPSFDIDGDGRIDMKDIAPVARYIGEHYP